MDEIFKRTIGLLGEENFNKIKNKTVAIFGLGGVGGTALEALARSGVQNFIIADYDVVQDHNLNRQILFTFADIGKKKTDAAKQRILSINKDAKIITIDEKISQKSVNLFENYKIDYIIDAIDDIQAKIEIIKLSKAKNIPLITSLGMAKRIDPSSVFITKLNKTTNDPFARKFRYEIKKPGLDISDINVAFSKEAPITDGAALNSMIFVPSSAGLNIASFVIRELVK